MKVLGTIGGITLRDRIRNEGTLRETGVPNVRWARARHLGWQKTNDFVLIQEEENTRIVILSYCYINMGRMRPTLQNPLPTLETLSFEENRNLRKTSYLRQCLLHEHISSFIKNRKKTQL